MQQTVAFSIMGFGVLLGLSAVIVARRLSAKPGLGMPGPATPGKIRSTFAVALLTVLIITAVVAEAWGLTISLRAYGTGKVPVLVPLIIAGVLIFFLLISYFVVLRTEDAFASRARRLRAGR